MRTPKSVEIHRVSICAHGAGAPRVLPLLRPPGCHSTMTDCGLSTRQACHSAFMTIDPLRRAQAARLLLDAVSACDLADAGSAEADGRLLLALEPADLDLTSNSHTAAFSAAAVDLLWFFFYREAQSSGATVEEVVSNARQYVLPAVYPEAEE